MGTMNNDRLIWNGLRWATLRSPLLSCAILLWMAAWGQIPLQAQPPSSYPLTVTSIIPQDQNKPFFESEHYLSEIWELSPTGEPYLALKLWGANALAYPEWVGNPQWSAESDWLGLTIRDRDNGESVVAYSIDYALLETALPPEAALTQFSPIAWRRDLSFLYVSGLSAEGQWELWEVALPSTERRLLTQGRFPILTSDETALIYLNDQDQVSHFALQGQPSQILSPQVYPLASSLALSPDGTQLAIAEGPTLYLIQLATGERHLAFQADSPQDQLTSLEWSPDGIYLAWILNRIPTETATARSQVLELEVITGQLTIRAERTFDPMPIDPRQFTGVSYQAVGAFVPINNDQDGL